MSQYEPDYVIPDMNDGKEKNNINDVVNEIVKEKIKKIRKKRVVIKKPVRKKPKKGKCNIQGVITKHDGTFKIIINT
jgi:hypothetical protein